MLIIGCDYHPSFQQIAFVDTETGEVKERRLVHREEAEKFYRDLAAQGRQVRVGMEASGHARWFERLLAELQFELWVMRPRYGVSAAQTEDGSTRCAAHSEFVAEGRLSADLGAELGEPGSAATSVASAPHGASAHSHHESTAGSGTQRRTAVPEEVVTGTRTPATGSVPVGSMGQPTPARSAGVAGSAEPNDYRTESSDRARGGKVSRSAAVDDASGRRSSHRTGLRADHRRCEPLSVWKAGGKLSRTGATGRFQWKSATAGTHHQAREFDVAFFAGGSGPGHGAQPARMAP